jgi:thiol-disulfide isomerase/thioredoxin
VHRSQDEQEALAESAAAGVQAAEDHQDMLQKKQQLPGILAGSTGGVQIPTQLAKIPSKKPIADEFVDRGCVSWRQTGNCDPYGMQEPDSDQDCDTLVASGWSGFCECADGKKVSHVDCAHETFTCAFRCARELAEDFFPPDFSEDDLTPAGISAKLQALTVFQELTPQNVHFYAHHNQKAFYLVLLSDGPGDTHMATVMEDLEKKIIANDQMQSVAWLWMKAVNQKLFRLDNVFLTANKKPSIVIDNIPNGANVEKYVFPKTNAMDADNAYAFFTDFEAGRGKLLVRSAIPKPLPSPMWNTDKVLDLVGVNFRDVVLTPGKTVLVMIYIPSCGGSQAVMPLMVQLAQHMKDNEDVIIARFDHSQSDFPVGMYARARLCV